MGSSELDALLTRFGVGGFFPLGSWFLLNIVSIYHTTLFLGNSLMSHLPEFKCGSDEEGSHVNRTMSEVCEIGCPGNNWTFSSSVAPSSSFAIEWGLVCEREIYAHLVEMLFFLGGFVFCFFVGYLSDKYGRRRTSMTTIAVAMIVDVNIIWVPNIFVYGLIRFVQGGLYVASACIYTYRLEMFSANRRFIATSCDFGWMLGSLLLPLTVYLIPNWRLAMSGMILTLAVLSIFVIYFSPESIPWLIKNRRDDEAFEVLKRMADARGINFTRKEYEILVTEDPLQKAVERRQEDVEAMETKRERDEEEEENDEVFYPTESSNEAEALPSTKFLPINDSNTNSNDRTKVNDSGSSNSSSSMSMKPYDSIDFDEGNFCQALRFPTFVWTLICSSLFWSYYNFVYIGLTFSYGTLAGNRLVNFALLSLMELPARSLAIPIVIFCKRRPTIFFSLLLIATSFLLSASVRGSVSEYESDYADLRKALSMLAKISVTFLLASFWLWQQESFPTLLRGRSFLFACCIARAVSALACFSSFLQTRFPLELEATIGCAGILMMLLTFKMPETLNEPLPQTMGELNAIKKRTRRGFC